MPAPSCSSSTTSVSATAFRDLVNEPTGADGDDGEHTDEQARPFLEGLDQRAGLSPTTFGTAVHRLCELSLSGVDLDWEVHPSRVIDDPTCLTPDEVGRLRDHVNIGITRVKTLEEQLDVTTTHDELQVTLDLDTGHIVGDIDHLTVTEDCYYVTDYKTDSLDKRDVDDLAAHYWPQLRVYACGLQQASPKDAVVLRLLFTDGDELLTETLRSDAIKRFQSKYNDILKERTSNAEFLR